MTFQRGSFIVLEGCDRAGKSTQCQRIKDFLISKGIPTELVKFPERTTVLGKTIDNYLKNQQNLNDQAIHLLFSANRWELVPLIKEKLTNGITLIVDRYAYSGIAFSAAKGLDLEWCKSPDKGLPKPDLTLFLDLTIEEMSKRGGFGEERYEKAEFQRIVRDIFHKIGQNELNWKMIDASQNMNQVFADIQKLVWETIIKEKQPISEKLFL